MANEELHKIIPVPLPVEVPEPPALDNLPLDVIHSATVEMLLQQNDDLASRLKVNIRRNSIQEQEILKLQRQLQELQRVSDNLKSQNELIKEKESLWQKQRQSKERQLKTNQEEIKLLELRYNELFTATKHKKKELYREIIEKNNDIEELKKKIIARKQISERGKEKVREMLVSAAGEMQEKKDSYKQTFAQNEIYKKQIQELKAAKLKKEELFKQKMIEISNVSKEHIHRLEEKVSLLEGQIEEHKSNEQSLEQKFLDKENQLIAEMKNRETITRLTEEVIQFKNEKVATERSFQKEIDKIKEENSKLSSQNQSQTKNSQDLQNQLNETKAILDVCEKKLIDVTRDNEDLEKQLESLKVLWADLQQKFEKEKIKNESLNKINKQLSKKVSLEKKQKSIQSAQVAPESSKLEDRLSDIYASQFGPLNDQQNLDV